MTLLCRSSASALPSESSFWGMWRWNSRPLGLSARVVVGFDSIVGLKSTWSQPLIASASKGAAEVVWPGSCQVVASIVVTSGSPQVVGFESSDLYGGGSG